MTAHKRAICWAVCPPSSCALPLQTSNASWLQPLLCELGHAAASSEQLLEEVRLGSSSQAAKRNAVTAAAGAVAQGSDIADGNDSADARKQGKQPAGAASAAEAGPLKHLAETHGSLTVVCGAVGHALSHFATAADASTWLAAAAANADSAKDEPAMLGALCMCSVVSELSRPSPTYTTTSARVGRGPKAVSASAGQALARLLQQLRIKDRAAAAGKAGAAGAGARVVYDGVDAEGADDTAGAGDQAHEEEEPAADLRAAAMGMLQQLLAV